MATVLLARDLRYDRPVALKVLAAELAQLGPRTATGVIWITSVASPSCLLPWPAQQYATSWEVTPLYVGPPTKLGRAWPVVVPSPNWP